MSFSQVSEYISNHVRLSLELHGGNIELVEVDGNVIRVKLVGACAHCPSSALTLYEGVEKMIKNDLSKDYEIEQVF